MVPSLLVGIILPLIFLALVQALNLYADRQPQLLLAQQRALDYVTTEQQRFEYTLEKGRRRLKRILDRRGEREIGWQDALELEKRHGIPQSLLEAMLAQQNAGFDQLAYQVVALGDDNE